MSFYTKPMIRFFARWMFLAIIFGNAMTSVLFGWAICVKLSVWQQEQALLEELGEVFIYLLFFLVCCAFCAILSKIYWREIHEKYWAKITITKSEIVWRCPFKKAYRMEIAACRYIGVELEDAFNKLDYPFVFFTKTTYPRGYEHKIDKLKVTDGFIKFWYTEDLAEFLIANFPKDKTGGVQYYREKQRRELREMQKKKR